jgi:hypothetical protein
MISSRCDDLFPTDQTVTRLAHTRKALKTEIEAMKLAGRSAFEVWINEETPPQGGTWDSWDTCMHAVRACDILIVISNGNAGWATSGGDVGICHAELMTGLSTAAAKVRLIALENIPPKAGEDGHRDRRFQTYVDKQSLFRGGTVKTESDLKTRVKDALHDAVVSLAQAGVREATKGKFHSGDALDWSRLDLASRQAKMIQVLREAVLAREGSSKVANHVFVRVSSHDLLFQFHAIAAAISVAPAREAVGQPFLRDHLLTGALTGKRGGPVHIIACHKNATETQAAKLLGFPDATFVSAPFGIFAADPIQNVQFAFIANCRDDANTRHGLQRFMEWLSQTGEDVLMAERAMARSRIIAAIAKEAKQPLVGQHRGSSK